MITQSLSPRPVVAAAIVDSLENPTKLLATARAYPELLRGQFEFPGGKVEPGELWDEALQREIFEELSLTIQLGAELVPPSPQSAWPILQGRVMRVWLAEPSPQNAAPQQGESHSEVRWVSLDDVTSLTWLPSNRAIVDELLMELKRE